MLKSFFKYFVGGILCCSVSAQPQTLEPTATMRTEAIFLVQLLEQFHYSGKKLNTLSSGKFLENYLLSLDPQKMFFYATFVDKFVQDYQPSIELLWRGGSLTPGFEIFKQYQELSKKRIDWILKRLDFPFNFSTKETYKYDRKNENWSANLLTLDHLWEQRLQHELLNEMLCTPVEDLTLDLDKQKKKNKSSEPITKENALKNEAKARENLKDLYKTYAKQFNALEGGDVQELYSNTLTQLFDPHTTFLSFDSMSDFTISIRNSLVGIGAYLQDDKGTCIVKEVLPGGPAEQSQCLHAGDKILSVAQGNGEFVSIQGMKLRNSVKLIRGPKGSLVRLLIQPADGENSERKIVEITRDEIKLENNLASAKILLTLDRNNRIHRIGWIDLPAFYGPETPGDVSAHTLSGDVKELIETMKPYAIEGIILDMRRNGGGLLSEAVNLTGLFLNNSSVVQVKMSDGQLIHQYGPANSCIWTGPLMVLTSRFSASASEIVAGALKCHQRALIFGEKTTHGKGSVQAIIELDKLSTIARFYTQLGAVKLTIQKWYLPNGNSTQLRGVNADLWLPSIYDCLPIGESDLPNALPWDKVLPMRSDGRYEPLCNMIQPALMNYLHILSLQRQNSLPMYLWHKEQVDWFTQKYNQTKVSLNLDSRIKTINEERELRQRFEKMTENFNKYMPIGKTIYLKDLQKPKNKSTETFDIFEYESTQLMTDWLFLQEQALFEYLWSYISSSRFNRQILF